MKKMLLPVGYRIMEHAQFRSSNISWSKISTSCGDYVRAKMSDAYNQIQMEILRKFKNDWVNDEFG